MNCQKCGKKLKKRSNFCDWCGTWTGQGQMTAGAPVPLPMPVPTPIPIPKPKRSKGMAIAFLVLIALALLLGGLYAGHFFGFYSLNLPFLTSAIHSVKVLQVNGTVEVERPSIVIPARANMRLWNLDTVRTGSGSSSWLSLDDSKAVELSEWTSVRIDKQGQGFVLTLQYGEIKNQIDQPLHADEEYIVKAGSLALSVRGTVFTVNYTRNHLNVAVASGEVAVLNEQGEEIAVLQAGESGEYTNYEVGDIVNFGSYSWLVLEVNDGKALLISEYILECRAYNTGWVSTTWAECELRAYLNSEFYHSFDDGDRAKIAETELTNDNNPRYGTAGGANTSDRIFLLSIGEAERYFSGNSARLAYDPSGTSLWWWLRSPGFDSRGAACVADDLGDISSLADDISNFADNIGDLGDYIDSFGGYISYFGAMALTEHGGVRPALWVYLY
jgi:hypothetical protein